jgi:Na+/phosphate symporter
VAVDQPMWQLTRRGLIVVMALLATVMGSAVVTCLVAFLSVSNSPL